MKGTIARLTAQGFKSFNKKISIPLVNGFNVFCGPNGVGKSNVIDAICFVLGRTSAKSLRADRLHELIFHGGSGKAAADHASITMYLDNSQKHFGYDDTEVSVTRKVNRKGVSVYKIQGKTTTREKMLQLLASAMIYPDGHNIVMQGDVTSIIEMDPIERRYVIDEISGIADYNERKDKAQKDLDVVDQKLKEAEIIITERYDIFKKLEEERNAAVRFQTLQKELQLMKASLAHKKLSEYQKTVVDMQKEIEAKEQEGKRLEEEIERIEADLERRDKGMQELVGKLIDMSKRVEEEKEISFLRTKILMNRDRIDANKNEVERLNSMISRLETIESRQADAGSMPRAVKAILDQKLNGVHGMVASLIKIPEKYQTAIEVAAGMHMNDLVVDSDATAKFCIDFLKREKIGRATFLPLNKIKARELIDERSLLTKNGVVGLASNLVKYDKAHEPAVRFVLGSTIVADNLDIARGLGIGKARMVTLDGDLIERSGAMVGGYYFRTKRKIATETAKDEIVEYQQLRKKLEDEIKQLAEEIEKFDSKLKEYEKSEKIKEFVDMEKLKIDSEDQLDKLRQRRKLSYEKKLEVQTEINKLNIQKAKIDAELESIKIEIQQYGQIQPIDKAISTLQSKVRSAERELATLGPVNFKAIEQYEKFKTEFDEYKKKYEKILEEKKAVLDMIEKIEEKRRNVFYSCLQEVSKYFDEIFKQMTNGNASLELENPLDLESGLIIQANPGSKKLLNIDSMSGGEKTLTALAFLFSVQKYRPTPFYILDEIDAALDKENSKKVAVLIKFMSKSAQFIVITHNDTTIKYGDVVYGVTMESGESKILGLELPKE